MINRSVVVRLILLLAALLSLAAAAIADLKVLLHPSFLVLATGVIGSAEVTRRGSRS
jgi:hypothetical protein